MRTLPGGSRAGGPLQTNARQCAAGSFALILLGEQGMADGFQLFLLGFVHYWEGKMEIVERLDNRGGHDQPRKPLVVARNDEPRRVLLRGILYHPLASSLAFLPEASFVGIRHQKLPASLRVLEPPQEAVLMLLLRHIK